MIIVELTAAIDAAGTQQALYLSDARLVTLPTDTPADTAFDDSLLDPGSIALSAFGDGRTGGGTRLALGEIRVANLGGQYDGWLAYGFDGRPVTIRRGASGAYPAAYPAVFVGTVETLTVTRREVIIRLRDKQLVLDRPVLTTTYGGTNALPDGIDGTPDDLAGKPKPLLFGRVYSIAPPMVNTSRLIYQISDGAILSVDAIYDRGADLTNAGDVATPALLQSATVAGGTYVTCLAAGLFRLGATPAGQITADATSGAGATDRTAGQALLTLAQRAGLTGAEISSADIAQLDLDQPSTLGFWASDAAQTFTAVMDAVATTAGAFYAFSPTGVLRFARLTVPTGVAALALESYDVFDPFERRPARDGDLPAWSYTINHTRYWSPQTSDLAASVTGARRAALGLAYRSTRAEDATVKNQFILAGEESVDSLFVVAAEAGTEAARRLALFKTRRNFFEVGVPLERVTESGVQLMDVVQLTNARFGLSGGSLFRLLGIRFELARNRAFLTLWG